jgi:ATP-dependent Lon protease, bacterial type
MNEVHRATLYPVLPLRDIVVFPHMIVPLFVGREKSVRALEDVMKDDKQVLLATQKNAAQDDPQPEDIYTVGTIGTVLQLLKLPDGTVKVLIEGGSAPASPTMPRTPPSSRPMPSPSPTATTRARRSRRSPARCLPVRAVYQAQQEDPAGGAVSINQIEDQSKLADTVASHLGLKIAEKQELLETQSVVHRLERVFAFMEGEIGVLQVEKRIRSRVKRQMEKTQREYYLNEQLKAIQKELGDGDEARDELAEVEQRIRKTKLSKEAREKALAEVKKLRSMSPMSAEATVVRNYLDWVLGIPWNKPTKVKHDIRARRRC